MKNWTFKQISQLFEKEGAQVLKGSKHALEKECLRVDYNGMISQKPHPKALGSALTHPNISTDFSEAQLELITPTFKREEGALKFLEKLHAFIIHNLDNEMLWPFSVPGLLPKETEIPLARYGTSNRGIEKYLYRKGLAWRFGRKMQTLSGIHYNFSFSEELFDFLYDAFGGGESKRDFISETYLRIVRNFLRIGWLNSYLFGASPAVDSSFLDHSHHPLKAYDNHTLYGEFATSIRMSNLGYYSKTQMQAPISFNALPKYLSDLSHAVSTPYPSFSEIGLYRQGERIQLNDHILQIEAEHYSRIRPKPRLLSLERPLDALQKSGIVYLEVRSVDCNPYHKIGVELDQLTFLHLFLIYCLFRQSPPLYPKEYKIISDNQNKVALFGRQPKLKLFNNGKQISLSRWGEEILDKMTVIAEMLSNPIYQKSLERQKGKLRHPELLLSAQILEDLKHGKVKYVDLGRRLGKQYLGQFQKTKIPEFTKKMEKISTESLYEQEKEEIKDDFLLKGYEDLEISTQLILREAFERGIEVEIVDRSQNLLLLKKRGKAEYLKQATLTSKDSLIAYALMKNKHVTKTILEKAGISVPKGVVCKSLEEAKKLYDGFAGKKAVVKPKLTNYGIAVSFVEPHDHIAFEKAVKMALRYGQEIILESFCLGNEYRFLVMGDKVCAICLRLPANVVGDGKHTIKQLVDLKNADPKFYKQKSKIHLDQVEKDYLKEQGLKIRDIPKKGERIFLRQNSNVSTGGESIDYTDAMDPFYSEIALKAAKAVGASICGVDMMIRNVKQVSTYHIIELNYNPALYLHRYPVQGKKRYVEKDVLNFLGLDF